MNIESVGSPFLWAGIVLFVLAMLAIDLGIFHRKAEAVTLKSAAIWSGVWVFFAMVFAGLVYKYAGREVALQFTTGYVIEKALAVDNIFVFVVIFNAFAIPPKYQHRVLFWGILGALVMRAIFILIGGAFLEKFHWGIYVFGGILAVTGIKLLLQGNKPIYPERNPLVRAVGRIIPITKELHGSKFIIWREGRRHATPLFLALVAVEITDLIFAVDSIPAIFAITRDPFIVFTSNIFAILGLRSMYFLLAGVIDKFVYLKTGLSLVLIFVGIKMLLMHYYKMPVVLSLGIIGGILSVAIIASFAVPPKIKPKPADGG